MYGKAKGFVLGCGDPETAKYVIILEAPGGQEVQTALRPNPNRSFLTTQDECDRELQIRKRSYPEFDEKWLRMGFPVAGPTGYALFDWICKRIGILRSECYIDNTIRCLAPKGKDGANYPKGEDRKEAEKFCRQYDRLDKFRPNTVVVSIHPASLLRGEVTTLPLIVKDFEKVRDFTAQGRKVLTLLGGKAAHAFLRYASNVSKWRGTYQALASNWSETYKSLFDYTRKRKKEPKVMIEGVCGKKHCGKKKAPSCGYTGCVAEFEQRRVTNEIPSECVER
jgi:uracil-DNA glycosylase